MRYRITCIHICWSNAHSGGRKPHNYNFSRDSYTRCYHTDQTQKKLLVRKISKTCPTEIRHLVLAAVFGGADHALDAPVAEAPRYEHTFAGLQLRPSLVVCLLVLRSRVRLQIRGLNPLNLQRHAGLDRGVTERLDHRHVTGIIDCCGLVMIFLTIPVTDNSSNCCWTG